MCVETFLLLGLHWLTLKCGIYQEGRLKLHVPWTNFQDLWLLVFQSLCLWFSFGLLNLYILCCSVFEYHLIYKPFVITAYRIRGVKVLNCILEFGANGISFGFVYLINNISFTKQSMMTLRLWFKQGCPLSLIIIHGGFDLIWYDFENHHASTVIITLKGSQATLQPKASGRWYCRDGQTKISQVQLQWH